MDQNFNGEYPKLCVTLQKTVGISKVKMLKQYFNFPLDVDRRPQYSMFINFNNECKISAETRQVLESRNLTFCSCCEVNVKSEKLSRQKRMAPPPSKKPRIVIDITCSSIDNQNLYNMFVNKIDIGKQTKEPTEANEIDYTKDLLKITNGADGSVKLTDYRHGEHNDPLPDELVARIETYESQEPTSFEDYLNKQDLKIRLENGNSIEPRKYRYTYKEIWEETRRNEDNGIVLYIACNPSFGGPKKSDATLDRLRFVTYLNGYKGFYVVNLFAIRHGDPDRMKEEAKDDRHTLGELIGKFNLYFIREFVRDADVKKIVFSWGAIAYNKWGKAAIGTEKNKNTFVWVYTRYLHKMITETWSEKVVYVIALVGKNKNIPGHPKIPITDSEQEEKHENFVRTIDMDNWEEYNFPK